MKQNYYLSNRKLLKFICVFSFLVLGKISFSQVPISHVYDTLCHGFTVILPGGSPATGTGTYVDTLQNINNNDSIIIVTHLTYVSSFSTVVNATICNGSSYTLPGGQVVSAPGTYIDTLTANSSGGCDSIITTNLTLGNVIVSTVNVTLNCIVTSYTLPGGSVVNAPGVYIDTLTASGGCDSIITTNITINNTLPNVFAVPGTVCNGNATSNNSVTYSWQGPCVVSGANSPSIFVSCSGTYTVTVTDQISGCTATTTIFINCNTTGIMNQNGNSNVEVYPNPGNGVFNVVGIEKGSTVEVFDVTGRIIFSEIANSTKLEIDLVEKNKGIYFYRISNKDGIYYSGKLILK